MFIKTMLNYILGLDASRDDGLTPIERLKLALKRKASKVVLTIALLKDPVSINNLTHLLSIPAFKIVNVLVPLQAIIRIPGNDTDGITLFHPSLRDYILDAERSITLPSSDKRDEQRSRLAHRCIELQLSDWEERHSRTQWDIVEYAAAAWLSLWSDIPRGSEWVVRDLRFLVTLGRAVVPNSFDVVFSLFCQGMDMAFQAKDRQHLWSFVDHFPGVLRVLHSFPGFRPQFEIIARAMCAMAARDTDCLVIELRRGFGGLHQKVLGPSLHRCMLIHAMNYILGDEEPSWSTYDGPCLTYILLYWAQHLVLAIGDARSETDLMEFFEGETHSTSDSQES
ncbi:hypothetical protein FA13DRAFT_260950 [Coprinellus micaceus]|uniref:Uncharacterized protein n=1 Tax=Coprinellus micaceus TaxID=71717 RepID=A0A4Y7TGC1_COPMI|nr:hypothetical protein FA13DRAFT_260950 [Coprinellus micaceus]